MRLKRNLQLFFRPQKRETSRSQELDEIEIILSKAPGIDAVCKQVLEDLGGKKTGAQGLSAETGGEADLSTKPLRRILSLFVRANRGLILYARISKLGTR